MKKSIFNLAALGLGLVLLWSCGDGSTSNPELVQAGEGKEVTPGGFMALHLSLSTENDSVLFDSREMGQPFIEPKLAEGEPYNSKVNELLQHFTRQGEIRTFTLTAFEAYEGNMPPELDSAQMLTMVGECLDVFANEGEVQAWQQDQMDQMQQAQYNTDYSLIDEYLAENSIEAQVAENGLRYVVKSEGNGNKPEKGDLIRVHYAGYLLDGTLFDTSIASVAEENNRVQEGREYEPLEFNVGAGMVIRGWDEGLLLFEEGSSGTIYIPSPMAYGARGAGGVIPPNAVLVFDVELVEIVKN
jgi:FKBP-type peptidyl-prolyl cis-trans isomerase